MMTCVATSGTRSWKARVVRVSFSNAAMTWIGGCVGLLDPADRGTLRIEVHQNGYLALGSEIARQISRDGRLAGPAFGVQDDDALHDVLMFYSIRVTRVAAKPTHAPMRLQAAGKEARV